MQTLAQEKSSLRPNNVSKSCTCDFRQSTCLQICSISASIPTRGVLWKQKKHPSTEYSSNIWKQKRIISTFWLKTETRGFQTHPPWGQLSHSGEGGWSCSGPATSPPYPSQCFETNMAAVRTYGFWRTVSFYLIKKEKALKNFQTYGFSSNKNTDVVNMWASDFRSSG